MEKLRDVMGLNVRDEINRRMEEMGVRNFSVFWSPEFVDRVKNAEPGPVREAIKDEGIREFLKLLESLERGEFQPLPLFGDASEKRLPEEIEALIKSTPVE